MNTPYLSVIITTFNEESRLPKTMDAVLTYFEKQDYSYEIVILDGGSKDHTVEVAKKYQESNKNIKIYETSNDLGKGDGIRLGIFKGLGQYLVFADADNSTPIEQIEKLLPWIDKDYDVVIGSRYLEKGTIKVKQPWYRRLVSRCGNMLIQFMLLPGIKDTQCGFKLFKGEIADDIFVRQTIWGFGFDIEILTIAKHLGYKIKEVPVDWFDDPDSKLRVGSASKDALKGLFRIKLNLIRGIYD